MNNEHTLAIQLIFKILAFRSRDRENRLAILDIALPHFEYVGHRLCFSEIINNTFNAWSPDYFEILKFDTITNPMIAHVH